MDTGDGEAGNAPHWLEAQIQRLMAQRGGESLWGWGVCGAREVRESAQEGVMAVLLQENPGCCFPDPPGIWTEAPRELE